MQILLIIKSYANGWTAQPTPATSVLEAAGRAPVHTDAPEPGAGAPPDLNRMRPEEAVERPRANGRHDMFDVGEGPPSTV